MTARKQSLGQRFVTLWRDPHARTSLLVWVQYSLPLVTAAVLLLLGAFYNVSAMQLGRPVRISVLRLLLNTLKSARMYLLGDTVSDGVRNFYLLLVVGAVLLMLFFLLSVAVSIFALCTLRRMRAAVAEGDSDGVKQAKILFCAFVPNRVLLFTLHAAVLPLALFPELFSLICSRFLTVSGGQSFYVRLNPVLLVVGILLIGLLVLTVLLRHCAGDVGLDPFLTKEEDDEDSDGADRSDDSDDTPCEGDDVCCEDDAVSAHVSRSE